MLDCVARDKKARNHFREFPFWTKIHVTSNKYMYIILTSILFMFYYEYYIYMNVYIYIYHIYIIYMIYIYIYMYIILYVQTTRSPAVARGICPWLASPCPLGSKVLVHEDAAVALCILHGVEAGRYAQLGEMGIPSWLVGFMEHPMKKWMTRGTPMTWETSIYIYICIYIYTYDNNLGLRGQSSIPPLGV